MIQISNNELREQIKNAIAHSLSMGKDQTDFDADPYPTPTLIILNNLTIPNVLNFYQLVKDELLAIQKKDEVKLSAWLKDSLGPKPYKKNVFDHEIAHVKAADTLGVDLSKSRLEAFFLTDGFGLQMVHHFVPPEDITPVTKLRIAFAPEELSESDQDLIKKTLIANPRLLTNDTFLTEIASQYIEKTGKEISSLLEPDDEKMD